MTISVSGGDLLTVADDSLQKLIVTNDTPVIVSTNNQPIIISDNDTYVITADSGCQLIAADNANVVVLAAGSQGPQGIRGQIGLSGGTSVELIAGMDLGGNRVVTGATTYADNTDLATVGHAIGVTTGSAVNGLPVDIVIKGEVDGFYGLTPNEPVYLSSNGTTTQILPIMGYLQKIGVALSNTKILISISEPFILA